MSGFIETFTMTVFDQHSRRDKNDDAENNFRKAVKIFAIALSFRLFYEILAPRYDSDKKMANIICTLMLGVFSAKTAFQTIFLSSYRITAAELCLDYGFLWPVAYVLNALVLRGSEMNQLPHPFMYVVACVLFFTAATVQIVSEYKRKIFKASHPGKVYQSRGFEVCRHVNHMCELVMMLLVSYCCGGGMALLVPIVTIIRVVCFTLPELEYYMRVTYGEEWMEYTRKTKTMLIPYVG